jgi:lysozyme
MYDWNWLAKQLEVDESRERHPYLDSVGKRTIGIGRNLDDVGLSDDEIDYLLANDIHRAEQLLDARLPWWRKLDEVRQGVLMDMAFNMGAQLFTFVNTLASVQRGDYAKAAKGMRASKWATQVGARAVRLATMMETGNYV